MLLLYTLSRDISPVEVSPTPRSSQGETILVSWLRSNMISRHSSLVRYPRWTMKIHDTIPSTRPYFLRQAQQQQAPSKRSHSLSEPREGFAALVARLKDLKDRLTSYSTPLNRPKKTLLIPIPNITPHQTPKFARTIKLAELLPKCIAAE